MSELDARAIALGDLLAQERAASGSWLSDAVFSCSEELLNAGDSRTALELAVQLRARLSPDDVRTSARLTLLETRAFRLSGQLAASLESVRQLLSENNPALEGMVNERLEARVLEGSVLWRLNRVGEAIEKLSRIHTELLARPDSMLLSQCAHELSSALFFAGVADRAKALALEALVSARRCGSTFHEGLALSHLMRLEKHACRWAAAGDFGRASLAAFEASLNRSHAAIVKRSLGVIAWKCGALDESVRLGNESAAECEALGSIAHARAASLLVSVCLVHR